MLTALTVEMPSFQWQAGVEITGGATRSRTGLIGFAIRCITALLSRQYSLRSVGYSGWHCTDKKGKPGLPFSMEYGAGKESRTLDLNLGKVALYQLSYSRVSSPEVYNNFWGGSKVSRNFFPFARRLIASCISA
jgi:hypothetical protein